MSQSTCPFCRLTFHKDKIKFHMGVEHLGMHPDQLDYDDEEDSEVESEPEEMKQNYDNPKTLDLNIKYQANDGKARGFSVRTTFQTDKDSKVINVENSTIKTEHEETNRKVVNPSLEIHHCKECKRNFKTRKMFKIHQKTEHDLKIPEEIVVPKQPNQYDCPECSKTLVNLQGLNLHMKVVHQSQRISCEFCGKQVVESKLQEHLNKCKITHEKKFSGHEFQCQKCKRSFALKSKLKEHQKVHENFRSECEFCKQTFASKYAKNAHVNSKHKMIQRDCKLCGKRFNSIPALNYHLCKVHGFKRSGSMKLQKDSNRQENDSESVMQTIQKLGNPKVKLTRISKEVVEKWKKKTFIIPKLIKS